MTATIYLAGPMQYSEDSESWRQELINGYDGFDFVDPTEQLNAEYEDLRWPQPGESPRDIPEGTQIVEPEEIVYEDKRLIGNADAVLVNLTETIELEVGGRTRTVPVPSYGTSREHEYVACQLGRPIAVWYSDDIDRIPVWAMSDTDFMSTDVEDCLQFLAESADQAEVSELLT